VEVVHDSDAVPAAPSEQLQGADKGEQGGKAEQGV